METICVPSYANIFKSEVKENYIYSLIKNISVIQVRYIDYILMVWVKPGSETIYEQNKSKAKEGIEFLDTLVYIHKNNRLHTTLYKKSIDCQTYLPAKSAQLLPHKKSIPYCQVLNFKRRSSTFQEYKKSCQDLIRRFVFL